jgi:transposase
MSPLEYSKMTIKRKPYKTYTREFKIEALRMMRESDRPASAIALELGIRRNQLYKWAEQLEKKDDDAFKGSGRPKKEDQSDLSKLKQENIRLQEEVAILKKAAAYFARELK